MSFPRHHHAIGLQRLRTIAAIFGAAAGPDRKQRAKLDLPNRVVRPVGGLSLIDQLVERQVEQGGDFFAGSVGAGGRPITPVFL